MGLVEISPYNSVCQEDLCGLLLNLVFLLLKIQFLFFIDLPCVLIYFQDHLNVDIKMVQRAMRCIIYISSSVSTITAHFEFICLLGMVFNCFRRFQALSPTDVAFIAVGGACGGDVEPPWIFFHYTAMSHTFYVTADVTALRIHI